MHGALLRCPRPSEAELRIISNGIGLAREEMAQLCFGAPAQPTRPFGTAYGPPPPTPTLHVDGNNTATTPVGNDPLTTPAWSTSRGTRPGIPHADPDYRTLFYMTVAVVKFVV